MKKGLLAGLVAGLIMSFFMLALRFALGVPSLVELVAEGFTVALPPSLFSVLLNKLESYAKPLLFAALFLVQIIVGGALGALYALVATRWPTDEWNEAKRGFMVATLLWVFIMITLIPALGGGLFGISVPGGALRFSFASLIPFAIYGIALGSFYERSARELAQAALDIGRRGFLKRAAIWTLIILLVGYGLRAILQGASRMSPSGVRRASGVMSTEITANEEFYIVSKNVVDPTVDLGRWNLTVEGLEGLVENPFTLTLAELQALP